MSVAHNLIWAGVALWFLASSLMFGPCMFPGDDTEPETWDNGLATVVGGE